MKTNKKIERLYTDRSGDPTSQVVAKEGYYWMIEAKINELVDKLNELEERK